MEAQEDVDLLVSIFYQGQDEDDDTLLRDSDEVLDLLRQFMQEKENLRIADVAPESKGKKKHKQDKSRGTESSADKKARRRREERRFWERLGHVLPDMNFRIWSILDRGVLPKYHKLLVKRSESIDKCVALQKQNQQLKQLLDQYLASKINQDLQIPPSQVIRVPVVMGKNKQN